MFSVIYKKYFLAATVVIFAVSLGIIAVFGLQYSIDFTGGALTEVSYDVVPTKAELESALTPLNLGGVSVRETTLGDRGEGYFIRTRDLSEEERTTLEETILAVGEGGNIERFTTVGPTIGAELSSKAVWALGFVSLIIILYVAYAFAGIGKPVSAWIYGLITIFVLFHDVLVPTAMMSLLGHFVGAEIDVLFVMAVLAVLGYSVNDTIVVFDRVRENLKLNRTERRTKIKEPGGIELEHVEYTLTKPFNDIIGPAVTETLGRSINTSFTTLLALIALYFFGGELTKNFALVLMAGVVAGTYSSICMAVPLLAAYAKWQAKREISK
ncbi:MAG: protein translocase subunit SecF [Candidatus Paceibacteria bacterium]